MDIGSGQTSAVKQAHSLFQYLCCQETLDIGQLHALSGVNKKVLQQAITWLQRAGLPLQHMGHDCWQLTQPIDNLDDIEKVTLASAMPIQYVFTTNSTNQAVKDNTILIAEHQTAGQGRNGKHWITPPGQSICLSYCRLLSCHAKSLSPLSLVVAIAVVETLRVYGLDQQVQIKWPNDIYYNGKKAGGILLKLEPQNPNIHRLIVGIGLNWCVDDSLLQRIDQPVNNLVAPGQYHQVSRKTFIQHLLNVLHSNIDRMLLDGFVPYRQMWEKYDFLHNKSVHIYQPSHTVTGRYKGINDDGLLKLQTQTKLMLISSGEVSVRPV